MTSRRPSQESVEANQAFADEATCADAPSARSRRRQDTQTCRPATLLAMPIGSPAPVASVGQGFEGRLRIWARFSMKLLIQVFLRQHHMHSSPCGHAPLGFSLSLHSGYLIGSREGTKMQLPRRPLKKLPTDLYACGHIKSPGHAR